MGSPFPEPLEGIILYQAPNDQLLELSLHRPDDGLVESSAGYDHSGEKSFPSVAGGDGHVVLLVGDEEILWSGDAHGYL